MLEVDPGSVRRTRPCARWRRCQSQVGVRPVLMARRHLSHTVVVTDHYADETYRWWHLSRPSPELLAALGDGWLPSSGRALDVGCGLGVEAGYLAAAGWQVAGIDLSQVALARAAAGHDGA